MRVKLPRFIARVRSRSSRSSRTLPDILLRMSRISLIVFLAAISCAAEDLPLNGISHVAFRVTDLAKARDFYQGVLGLPEAFTLKDKDGNLRIAFLKVNDDQYFEVAPGLTPGSDLRMTHVSFVTTDIERLHSMLAERGLKPTDLRPPGPDGTRGMRVTDPFGNPIEFTQYLPGSLHAGARGKFQDPKRISMHLLHAGIAVPKEKLEDAMAFYRDKLGFVEFWRGGPTDGDLRYVNMRVPGARGDYVELMLHDPSPDRARLGSMQHACLEVPGIQKAYRTAVSRGVPESDKKFQPKIGRNGKWQFNLFDPDGSRTEMMEPNKAK